MAEDVNPAGVLLKWLRAAKEREAGESAIDAFGELWGIEAGSVAGRAEFLRLCGLMAGLTVQVRRKAEALPPALAPDVLLTNFGEVEQTVSGFLLVRQRNVEQFFGPMQGTGWHCLELLDRLFEIHGHGQPLDLDRVPALIEGVRALIDDVLGDDDLPPDLRKYLIARLQEVEVALIDCRIAGPSGVVLVADALVGSTRRDRDLWSRIAETKWAPRLGALYVGLCMTISTASSAHALMPGVEPDPAVVIERTEPEAPTVVPVDNEADS